MKRLFSIIGIAYALALAALPAEAATDKWGGDDRVRNPQSAYQTGTATATASYTLTDASKNWAVNSMAGRILQPDVTREVYFLIKSNSATQITVYGNDTVGHDEECHRHISDENAGGENYAILDRWTTRKVNSRWWLFDPYGNSYFAKSVNNFGGTDGRRGGDISGVDYITLLNNNPLYGGNGTDASGYLGNLFNGVADAVKTTGFNTLGATVDAYRAVPGSCYAPSGGTKTPARYFPWIGQVRVSGLKMLNTGKFTTSGASIADATDPNFGPDMVSDILSGNGNSSAATEGYRLFDTSNCSSRGTWSDRLLTPYAKARYNLPANPYFIGFDWDEEPAYLRSENSVEHMGYRVLTSAQGTPRKTRAMAYLHSRYADIAALNAAWGTSYADWTMLEADTGAGGIDAALSSEPNCRWNETNVAMKTDLDGIAEDFWRSYTQKVHDALDSLTAAHVLNYGPGYHGWSGASNDSFKGTLSPSYLFRGSVSADGATPYIDIIGIGDPLHGAHTSATPDFYENMKELKSLYQFHGRPYHHESVWITAEADSAVAYTGTISSLTATTLSDASAHFDGLGVNYPAFGWGSTAPRRMILIDPLSHAPGNRKYFSICVGAETGCPAVPVTDTDLNIRYQIADSDWQWNSTSPDMRTEGLAGKPYVLVAHDAFGQIGGGLSYPLFVPLTQEERGTMYAKFIRDALNFKADNGDSLIVGFSQWEWFDFSFRNTTAEFRNFGFMTVRGNLYDDSANIANGEVQDCGDFVSPVKRALTSVYDTVASSASSASPTDTTPPTVSVTAPLGGATVTGVTTVGVLASDTVGVTKVELYVNGTFTSSTTTAPYIFAWDTKKNANGTCTVAAKAYDAAGNVASSTAVAVVVANDVTAPSVTITSPTSGSSVKGSITVSVAASDNVGITKAQLYVNGQLVAENSTAPYSLPWNTTAFPVGANTVQVWCYDAAGNVGKSAAVTVNVLDSIAPTVKIASPLANSVVSGTVSVSATATDNVGVASMSLFIDGYLKTTQSGSKLSYSWHTSGLAKGTHKIVIRATDQFRNTGSTTIYVTK